MNKTKPGFFITVEGIEGVGKSTAVKFITDYLAAKNKPIVSTREPGGTPIAEKIRQVLLNQYDEPMSPDTELLLLFAGRAQHLAQVIFPALSRGDWVVCDRFTDASFAYQGGGRGLDSTRIAVLEQWVQAEFRPNLTLLLDAPVEVSFLRLKERGQQLDRFEAEKAHFFQRIRECYLARAAHYPERFRLIDASQTLENVQQQLVDVLNTVI